MRVASRIAASGLWKIPHTVTLAILIGVVLALAILQARWIAELSTAHEARADSRVQATLRALADAFDTEVSRAVLVAEPTPPMPSDGDRLEARWREWNATARWPGMVSGIAVAVSSGGVPQVRWLGRRAASDLTPLLKAFEPPHLPMPEPPRLSLPGLPRTLPGPLRGGFVYQLGPREAMVDGEPAIVLPMSAFSSQSGVVQVSSVLIRFDGTYLAETVLPQLVEAHASAEDRREFRIELRRVSPRPTADERLTIGVFRFRPDCVRGPIAMRSFRGPIGAEPLAPLLEAAGECRIAPDPNLATLMQLAVHRRQGPMMALATGFRWRQQAAGGLVLVALVVTMAFVVLSAERARRQARQQTVLAAGISHELRTPLASLRLAADELKSVQADSLDRARHYGDIIDLQSRRLGRVVDQALALTGAANASALRPRALSIVEIADAALEAFAPALRQAGVVVERRAAPDVPVLLADPDVVTRCLTNLIENALRYAAAGGSLVVSAQPARRAGRPMVELTVEDRGPGIDADETAAVFDAFYRGRSARASRQAGSGLGLAIVRSGVEAHGGWLALERVQPQGCRFRLFFPAEDPRAGVDGL